MPEGPAMTETAFGDIDKIYARLQSHFHTRATLPLHYRIYNLKQLYWLLRDNEEAIFEAIKADSDEGPLSIAISDLWPVYNEIALAIKRLPTWAYYETRWWDSMLAFKFMYPIIHKQPKGVSLIISPWNFPWQLTMCPLVGAIAAGCPVVIKPSELSPSTSALMAKLVAQYLDPASYAVVLGGPEVSTHLLEKQWGHVMYTGSGRVGSIVAAAAAKTLSPVSLELGGKSPVVVSKCADLQKTARRLFSIKQLKCGQMCVTPDYVLCDREVVDEFISACIKTLDEFYPSTPHERSMLLQDFTSRLQSQKAYDRMLELMDQADAKGRLVYRGETNRDTLRMGFSIVQLEEDGRGESGPLVEEELFGPVLPVIPYSSLDAAIEYINNGPHPLALYVCASKKKVWKKVVNETTSGSATWNDFGFATYARGLPFGGVGGSGYGAYHGQDGFRTFTHYKTTLRVPYLFEPLMQLRYPPISSFGQTVLKMLLLSGSTYNRPKSLDDEKRRFWWRRWYLAVCAISVALVVSVLQSLDNILGNLGNNNNKN